MRSGLLSLHATVESICIDGGPVPDRLRWKPCAAKKVAHRQSGLLAGIAFTFRRPKANSPASGRRQG